MRDGLEHVGVGASAAAAALPMLVYLIVIYRFDRYEREPVWLVGLTFLYGAVGAIVIGATLSVAVIVGTNNTDIAFGAGVVAPLCEEPAKALIVYIFLSTKHFDNTTDGLIYGAASGLGFGMTENFLYFSQVDAHFGAEAWQGLVIVRSLFSAVMHCAATATFGAVVGRFRYRGGVLQWLVGPLIGLSIAITMHAIFNTALVKAEMSGVEDIKFISFGLIPIAGAILFTVTMISLGREHRMLAAELREEAAVGLLPPLHADILPFHRKRWRKGWLDPRVDKKRYIETATLLAFRKWQSKLPAGRRPEIHADVVRLRYEVRCLLYGPPPPQQPLPQQGPYYPPPN